MIFYPFLSLLLCIAVTWVATQKSKKKVLNEKRFRLSLYVMVPLLTTSLATTILLEKNAFTWSYFFYCLTVSGLVCFFFALGGRKLPFFS